MSKHSPEAKAKMVVVLAAVEGMIAEAEALDRSKYSLEQQDLIQRSYARLVTMAERLKRDYGLG